MNKELIVNVIMTIIAIAGIILLWPVIKWLAVLCLVVALALIVITFIQSKKIKKEIEKNPNSFYSSVNNTQNDVIDVEYKEKVVEEEK